MRRWQFLIELLLHQALMVDPLYLSFFLGCSARLPLMACYSSLLWSRLAENKIVLDNASWQFGLSSFVLRHFFFLGVGFELSIKCAGVAKFFDPIKSIVKILWDFVVSLNFLNWNFFFFFPLFMSCTVCLGKLFLCFSILWHELTHFT